MKSKNQQKPRTSWRLLSGQEKPPMEARGQSRTMKLQTTSSPLMEAFKPAQFQTKSTPNPQSFYSDLETMSPGAQPNTLSSRTPRQVTDPTAIRLAARQLAQLLRPGAQTEHSKGRCCVGENRTNQPARTRLPTQRQRPGLAAHQAAARFKMLSGPRSFEGQSAFQLY